MILKTVVIKKEENSRSEDLNLVTKQGMENLAMRQGSLA